MLSVFTGAAVLDESADLPLSCLSAALLETVFEETDLFAEETFSSVSEGECIRGSLTVGVCIYTRSKRSHQNIDFEIEQGWGQFTSVLLDKTSSGELSNWMVAGYSSWDILCCAICCAVKKEEEEKSA